MAKTEFRRVFDIGVNALGAGLNKFRVEVKHTNKGWGNPAGVIVCLTPYKLQVFDGCNIEGRVFDDKWQHGGLVFRVVQYARYSPKKVQAVWDAISPIAEELKDNFIAGNKTECYEAIKKVCPTFVK